MIGRFFYHAFWNFYDYLGTLTLTGALHLLMALGVAAATGLVDNTSLAGKIAFGLMVIVQFVLMVLLLAGLLPFCAKAARDEPARWPDLKAGIKYQWPRVARTLGLWAVVLGLLVVNFFFYLKMNTQVQSPGLQMGLIIISASVGWLILAWLYFAAPWLCASTSSGELAGLKQTLAKGLMVIALLPGVWLTVLICLVLVFCSGLYTRLGLIFFLPALASIGQTAYALSVQYATFLAAAREEMGEGVKLRSYKRRARELAWEWEHRQPRRTFKELIRPWEY